MSVVCCVSHFLTQLILVAKSYLDIGFYVESSGIYFRNDAELRKFARTNWKLAICFWYLLWEPITLQQLWLGPKGEVGAAGPRGEQGIPGQKGAEGSFDFIMLMVADIRNFKFENNLNICIITPVFCMQCNKTNFMTAVWYPSILKIIMLTVVWTR